MTSSNSYHKTSRSSSSSNGTGGSFVVDRLKSFDVFRKYDSGFVKRTQTGAIVSCFTLSIIVFLCITQLGIYWTPIVKHHLNVDTRVDETVRIHFDVNFPKLDCEGISVDVTDKSGRHSMHISLDHVSKRKMNADGSIPRLKSNEMGVTPGMTMNTVGDMHPELSSGEGETKPDACGSCYGAAGPDPKFKLNGQKGCCNTCEDVRKAYKAQGWKFDSTTKESISICQKEILKGTFWSEKHQAQRKEPSGCNIAGFVDVPRIGGGIHFSPSTALKSLHGGRISIGSLVRIMHETFDLTHRFQHVRFGEPFPGAIEPLNGLERTNDRRQSGMFQYYVKVVRTEYEDRTTINGANSAVLASNQYSVTEHFRRLDFGATATGAGLPGIYIFYDFSPVCMRIEKEPRSLSHLLTMLCAVVGGTFTVMGLLDGFIERGLSRVLRDRLSSSGGSAAGGMLY